MSWCRWGVAVRVESFSQRANPLANTGSTQIPTVRHITDALTNTGTTEMPTVYYHRQQKRSSSCSCSWQLDLAQQAPFPIPLSPCFSLHAPC